MDAEFSLNFTRELAQISNNKPRQIQPGPWASGVKFLKEHFRVNPQRDARGNRSSDDGVNSCDDSDCQMIPDRQVLLSISGDRVEIPLYIPHNHHNDHRQICDPDSDWDRRRQEVAHSYQAPMTSLKLSHEWDSKRPFHSHRFLIRLWKTYLQLRVVVENGRASPQA